jgi:hypothetical protein
MKSIRKKIKALLGGGALLLLVFTFVSQAAAQTWTELFPIGGPPNERNFHSAVYDPATNRMIMFGGAPYHEAGAPTLYNDVWVLSNADGAEASTPTWTQLNPTGGGPNPRGFHSAVYDPATNRMIVFGGDPSIGYCFYRTNDVWVLENANGLGGTPNWLQLNTTGGPPSPRGLHSAVYDPATNRMIMFGGNNACEPANNDVWVLENANGHGGTPNWIQLTPSGAVPIPVPGASSGHAAVYDQANNRMIVFEGFWCCTNDVYVLENANGIGGTPNWIQLSPSGTPPEERAHQTTVYDSGTNRMILFGGLVGGVGFANDLWVLSNANGLGGIPEWIQLSPAGGPPVVRDGHIAIYNPAANRMTVFGGRTSGFGLNDVWVLTYANGIVEITVAIDIKPQSCPNPLNIKSKGVLPAAILGADDFDVTTIDPASIRLAGVAPIRSGMEDVSTPTDKQDGCECTTEGSDGYTDLTLKFDTQEIVATLGEVADGEELILTLTGELLDGTPIKGEDCIVVLSKRGKGKKK